MGDFYSEVLVKKKKTPLESVIKVAAIAVTAVTGLLGLLGQPLILIVAVVMGVLCYLFLPRLDVEFEYTYVNGSMDVDRIYSKIKRKRAASYEFSEMEILAPEKSHQLDSYRQNRNIRRVDFSSGMDDHKIYALVIPKNKELQMVLFEPDEGILKDLRSKYPRKVFYD